LARAGVIDFTQERQRHRRFVGRDDVLAVAAYRPRHDWVREFIADERGVTTMRAHHATLSRKLATWPAPVDATSRRYALRHALVHRVEAGDWADAWHVAADTSFLEAKCRDLGAHEAEADMAWTAERCSICSR